MNPSSSTKFVPPAGFQPVRSSVEGISLYAPVKSTDPNLAPVRYACPQCGAPTRFDVAAGGVACEHCGYQAAARSEQVGRQAQETEFTLDILAESRQGWGVARRQLHCDACGAELEIAENALTATCPFCASNQVNVRQAPGDHLRPGFLAPFTVQPAECQRLAREWLGRGWYHPKTLASSAIIQPFAGIYLPFWTFSAGVHASWRAEVGHERTEHYYDPSSKTHKTRTHIDWRWESGQVQSDFRDLLVSGSSHVSQVLLERVQPFSLNSLATYSPDYLAGWQAQVYDVPLETAWEEGKSQMREQSKRQCRESIHSSHVRNFSMTADFGEEAWRFILLPVYLTAYRFEQRVFQVLVNGQTGKIAGQKPVDWWKVWLAIAAMLLPALVLGLIAFTQRTQGFLIFALIAFVLGVIGAVVLYSQAASSEKA